MSTLADKVEAARLPSPRHLYGNGHRPKHDPVERRKRRAARRKIVQAANRYATNATGLRRAPYTLKHLERCVGLCRRFGLVKPEVLVVAGFNPSPVHKGKYVRFSSTRFGRTKRVAA